MADDEEISVYDEVEIEDMTYDEALETYFYPCPCGDRFQIALADLQDEETDIAVCPSCSLMIRVIYEVVSRRSSCSRSSPSPTPRPSLRLALECEPRRGTKRTRKRTQSLHIQREALSRRQTPADTLASTGQPPQARRVRGARCGACRPGPRRRLSERE